MQIYVSYFYNIRFFPDNLIPVSTAIRDPKWYHDFKSSDYVFRDKRGIVNGLRAYMLSPHKIDNCECTNCRSNKDTSICSFIRQYHGYIFSLNFEEVYSYLCNISQEFNGSDICLMVYEKPDNPCSERATLVEWFGLHGIEVKELSRNQ